MTRNTPTLTIWLPEISADTVKADIDKNQIDTVWLFADESEHHSGSLEDLQQQIAQRTATDSQPLTCLLIVPGEHVTAARTKAPNKQALKAVPYLIEDRLATPLEELHVSHHIFDRGTDLLVISIQKQLLKYYVGLFNNTDIHLDALIPDYALLPSSGNLLYTEHCSRLLCRSANDEGFCLSTDERQRLDGIAKQQNTDLELRQFSTTTLMRNAAIEYQQYSLLTGDFKPKQITDINLWFKTGVVSLAACLSLFMVYTLFTGWQFSNRADTFYKAAEQHYLELFPETKRITNLRRQFQGKLNSSREKADRSESFLELFNQAVPALTNSNHSIHQIRYNQSQNMLKIELTSRTMNFLNTLEQDLKQNQLHAAIRSVNNSKKGVRAQLDISHLQASTH